MTTENQPKSIADQISEIIKDQYNNYGGSILMKGIMAVHALIRLKEGDEKFLQYLKECKAANPKPVYTPPPAPLHEPASNMNMGGIYPFHDEIADTTFTTTMREIASCVTNYVFKRLWPLPDQCHAEIDIKKLEEIIMKKIADKKQPKRDWEILAFSTPYMGKNNIMFHKSTDGLFYCIERRFPHCYSEADLLKQETAAIYSVRRLHDQKVFTVGDRVRGVNHHYDKTFTISKFSTNSDYWKGERISVWSVEQNIPMCDLEYIHPAPEQPAKPKDEQPKPENNFVNYLVAQKEYYCKKQDFETASQWRLVERLYREYEEINKGKQTGKYISLDEVVKEYLSKEKLPPEWATSYQWFAPPPQPANEQKSGFAWDEITLIEFAEFYKKEQGHPTNPSHIGRKIVDVFKEQWLINKFHSTQIQFSPTTEKSFDGKRKTRYREQDWEIVSILEKRAIYYKGSPVFQAAFKTNLPIIIYSVRRLSDNTTWTTKQVTSGGTIESFDIVVENEPFPARMRVGYEGGGGTDLSYLKLHPPQQKKDYEIAAFKTSDGIVWRDIAGYFNDGTGVIPEEDFIKNKSEIWAVERHSDGEMFMVGDFVRVTEKIRKGWSDPIERFLISGETMVAEFETWRQPLNDLERMHKSLHRKHPPTQPSRETLNKLFAGYNQAKKIGDNAAEIYLNAHPELKGQIPIEPEYKKDSLTITFDVETGQPFPQEKYQAIQRAVRGILNDESPYDIYTAVSFLESEGWVCMKHKEYYPRIERIREEAFQAGRRNIYPNYRKEDWKFPTFNDYIKSLK